MKYILVMLLAFVAVSCVVRDAKQYEGEWVELVDIRFEMRLIDGEWKKRYIYVYAPVKKPGIVCHITYPLNNNRTIGSKHLMPIQR
jgi:uncharacterized membrane protein